QLFRFPPRRSSDLLVSLVLVLWLYYLDQLTLSKEVFDSTGQGIIVTDPEGVIVSVNPMFTTLTGYEEKEAIGKRPNILSSGEHGKEFYEALWADIQKTGSWHGEIWNQRKNGETYLQLLSIDSVRDGAGDTIRYVG